VKIPLHVRPVNGKFQVVAGHRRYLAAHAAGVADVPALVMSDADGPPELIMLTENLFRQEMSPVEEGAMFAELFELLGHDVDEVCKRVGKKRGYVESRLNLLTGDAKILEALAAREISFSIAQELNAIQDPSWRHYYLDWTVKQGAKLALVKFWRATANGMGLPPGADVTPPAPPAIPQPTASEVSECMLCRQREPAHELRVALVHIECRGNFNAALDAAAGSESPAAAQVSV